MRPRKYAEHPHNTSYNNNNNNDNGDDNNNNDVIVKLFRNSKIIKIFIIPFLVTEELAQKNK